MAFFDREKAMGRLVEARTRRESLRVAIHSFVVGIVTHFEPMDGDLNYVDNIKPDRLEILLKQIKTEKPKLDKVNAEIKELEAQLGENQDR
jgi:hypothetical protein